MSTLDQAMNYLADMNEYESGTPNITMTTGSTLTASYVKVGKFVTLQITTSRAASTAVGSNSFQGTINDTNLRPVKYAQSCTFYGSSCVVGQILTNGAITFRVTANALASGNQCTIAFHYMTS